jgi:GT2 family glycosyltransferase/glycosyltransferase involved in cell wall biosynthesis
LSRILSETVKVLFASGSEDLIPTAIEHMRELYPEFPLVVVSEFPPKDGDFPRRSERWIAFPVRRTVRENLAMLRWILRGKYIRLSAVILQPRMPYWKMRLTGFLLSPRNFLAFNENYGHFMLRPGSIGTMLRHFAWRTRNFFVWHFSPGGRAYTLLWRLIHPHAFGRPLMTRLARLLGFLHFVLLELLPRRPVQLPELDRPRGVSVVIPSRDGKDLLGIVLPEVMAQIASAGGEVIVVDNGSSDGTADFLRNSFPQVICHVNAQPLSFARAVNAGIRHARYSHVCLLNNDMTIEAGFFAALLAAFEKVPDLFCATAQIFFPEGRRREETGKAVMPIPSDRGHEDFPVRCELPSPGEDLSYVLYGSGGCSLFEAHKLAALDGMDEAYEPAYAEDLDLGFRGWQQGWPSVFVAGARVVHRHRTTTSRYYGRDFLDQLLELNYLRFLSRAVVDPREFRRLWREAIHRLNWLAAKTTPNPAAKAALMRAVSVFSWTRKPALTLLADSEILAIGSGAVSVFPGRTPRNRPVILIASPYLPFPLAHGGAVRMYNLMRRAAENFDQVLISFTGAGAEHTVPQELLEICCEVVLINRPGTHLLPSTKRPDVVEEFDSPALHAAIRQTVRKWNPAIAQLEFTQMAQYARDCAPARTILVEHDVTLDLYQQLLAQGDDWELRRQLARWVPFEVQAWSEVDRVVTMSEKDAALVRRAVEDPARCPCLPNGVDLQRFRPSGREPEPRRVLFIGSFAHLPNVLAVDFFLREVWPGLRETGAALHIIAGARHEYFLDRYRERVQMDLDQPGIEIEDFVADVRPAYERAAVVVAPLLASAGTNIKIMEAMAMGKAVVSTPAGINGLDLESGRDVVVATSGEQMTGAILELFQHPEKRQAIERQARLTVESKFDWDVIAAEQQKLYEDLIK